MAKILISDEARDYVSQNVYRAIRKNLQLYEKDKKVIAFTSCIPDVCKSKVAINFAMSLAESGKNVIFIDGDFRNHTLPKDLKMKEKEDVKGIIQYFLKKADVKDIVCMTNIEKLYMIAAGSEKIENVISIEETFKELITILRDVYEYIIVDLPLIRKNIEADILAESCDGAILTIEPGKVDYRLAQEVKRQLDKVNCPVLGTVFISL